MTDEYEDNPLMNPDDELAFGEGIADGKSTQQIIDESKFAVAPLGVNEYFPISALATSKDTEGNYCEKFFEVYAKDEGGSDQYDIPTGYDSHEIEIWWALASDPKVKIKDTFRMPPNDESQHGLYMDSARRNSKGVDPEPKDRKATGPYHYNRVRAMLHAVGHEDNTEEGEKGKLPVTARKLGAWRLWPDGSRRSVLLNVVPQSKRAKAGEIVPNIDKTTGKVIDGPVVYATEGQYITSVNQDGSCYVQIKQGMGYERTPETIAKLSKAPRSQLAGAPKAAPKAAPVPTATAKPGTPPPPKAAPRMPAKTPPPPSQSPGRGF